MHPTWRRLSNPREDAIIGTDLDLPDHELEHGRRAECMATPPGEAVGQDVTILVPSGEKHETREIVKGVEAGRSIDNFETIRTGQGRQAHLRIDDRIARARFGRNHRRCGSIARDIVAKSMRKKLSAGLVRTSRSTLSPSRSLRPTTKRVAICEPCSRGAVWLE